MTRDRFIVWGRESLRIVLTLAMALFTGALIMWLSGKDALKAYMTLFSAAFGGTLAIADTLLAATPLIFTGLATAVAFRAGVFNVGVEGSLYLGAFAAAWVGFTLTFLPGPLILTIALFTAGLVGGVWALIPGYLKAKLGVDEIVTTIMLNYVAIHFTSYLVNYPFAVPGLANAMSPVVAPSATLPRLMPPSQLNFSFILALLAVVATAFLLNRTTLGYELRTYGANPIFARWSGIPSASLILRVMLVSGALGGLAGAGQVLGVNYRFVANFSPGYGFDGIAVALLGRNSAWGAFLGALLFGALRSGGSTLELMMDIPLELIRILEAAIIFFVTAQFALQWAWQKRIQATPATANKAD
ncbi:MAG TPA: ABC transporter permease [Anaerolineae bacterium]|nr:ABC transporter permease [Anaerolineae bacterium]